MTKLRIFLADDHTVVREGLRMVLNSAPDLEVVAEAGDGHRSGLSKTATIEPVANGRAWDSRPSRDFRGGQSLTEEPEDSIDLLLGPHVVILDYRSDGVITP